MPDLGLVEIQEESDATLLGTGQGSHDSGVLHVVLDDVNTHLQQGKPYMIIGATDRRGWRNLTFVDLQPANQANFDMVNAILI